MLLETVLVSLYLVHHPLLLGRRSLPWALTISRYATICAFIDGVSMSGAANLRPCGRHGGARSKAAATLAASITVREGSHALTRGLTAELSNQGLDLDLGQPRLFTREQLIFTARPLFRMNGGP